MAARTPIAGAIAVSIGFSPNYAVDGILLGGTLEDGVFYSNDRGRTWHNKSFGMLDAAVFSLAFSPNFAHDETVFVGAETTVYTSYNGALAWKEVQIPANATPALSLALSPHFQDDHTLYIGTEYDGLYRSSDGGQSWQKPGLPANCINALLASPELPGLVAATEAGVFMSADQGASWKSVLENATVISLAAQGQTVMAGVADEGVWWTADLVQWQPVSNLYTRSLLGLALSPRFDRNAVAYVYGPQDGIWKTETGGRNWASVFGEPLGQEINALAVGPANGSADTLAVATPNGVLISREGGAGWQLAAEGPANWLAFSPNGRVLAAGSPRGVQLTDDLGQTWQPVAGPWDADGQVLALAVDDARRLYVAWRDAGGETVAIWRGQPGQLENVLTTPAGANSVLAFVTGAADRPWYASLGNQVWTFGARKRKSPAAAMVFPTVDQAENILSLTVTGGPGGQSLLALTGHHIFTSSDAKAWSLAYDFGNERAVALALSPAYGNDKTLYALLLGGAVCQLVML